MRLLISLVALTVTGHVNAVPADQQTQIYDFEDAPDAATGAGFDPVFNRPIILSHDPAKKPKRGNAQWVSGELAMPFDGSGNMRLSYNSTAPWSGEVFATMRFSKPISVLVMQVLTLPGTSASIRPIPAAGSSPPSQPIPISTGGQYVQFELVDEGGGPYIAFELTASKVDSFYWDDLYATPSDAKIAKGIPVRGDRSTLLKLDHYNKAGKVVREGTLDAYFCVAPDPRETAKMRGKKASGAFTQRKLGLWELGGTGTCTGSLGDDLTWEQLLITTELEIAQLHRTFVGTYQESSDSAPIEGALWIIGITRTNAEFEGPTLVRIEPEVFGISYAGNVRPQCNPKEGLAFRELSLGGTIRAFGEWPSVDDPLMRVDAIQCNQLLGGYRRSSHATPARFDGTPNEERINVQQQAAGIEQTLTQVGACIVDTSSYVAMLGELNAVRDAFTTGFYETAVSRAEEGARIAQATDFSNCPIEANYEGDLVTRFLTLAFTIFDRWLHPDPATWEKYVLPPGLALPGGLANQG